MTSLSIIIVCRNPGPVLAQALQSVWDQQGARPELVVIDGASTDGTSDWLAQHRQRIDRCVSEPDAGIYAAMNKGVALARGEWVLFLGADDILADTTVAARCLARLATATGDVVAAEARFRDGRRYPPSSPAHAIRRNFLHHQATFYRRRVFAGGGFDERWRVMGDYEFNLRLQRDGVGFETHGAVVALCGPGGASDAGRWTGYREEISIRHRYFPAWRCLTWDLGSILRFARKRMRRRRA